MIEIGIICLLPEDVNSYYQELRQKIAVEFELDINRNVPAHITVKYPFPVRNVDEIEKFAEEFSISPNRASWTLCDFDHFINPEKYVVFIDAAPNKEIRKAHASFLDQLRRISWVQWGPYDHANLHYHVTLATQGIMVENFRAVWSFVNQQEKPNFEVFFDNLALVRIAGDDRSVYKTYHFAS